MKCLTMMEIDEWDDTLQEWLNSSRFRALGIISRCIGILTVLGVAFIIQDITKCPVRRKLTKNRIMLYMSICDLIYAFICPVLGSSMAPTDIGVPGAMGNQASCTFQGFIANTFGHTSAIYNCSLALCYLLIVRYDYSEEQLRILEPYFLIIPPVTMLFISIPGLPLGIYNFNGTYKCYLSASPLNCEKAGSPVECERGESQIYWRHISSGLFFIGFCIIFSCMVQMYNAVLQQEISGDRFRFRVVANPRRALSSTMRSQGLWYSGAFLFTFSPLAVNYYWDDYIWDQYIMKLLVLSVNSLGFTNAVIYIRPRFVKFRRENPNVGLASSIRHTLVRSRPANGESNMRIIGTNTEPQMMGMSVMRFLSMRRTVKPMFSGVKAFVDSIKSSITGRNKEEYPLEDECKISALEREEEKNGDENCHTNKRSVYRSIFLPGDRKQTSKVALVEKEELEINRSKIENNCDEKERTLTNEYLSDMEQNYKDNNDLEVQTRNEEYESGTIKEMGSSGGDCDPNEVAECALGDIPCSVDKVGRVKKVDFDVQSTH